MPEDYLREIEVPGILEILGEKWDNALELMHGDALVYGGAIRDIIAGLPFKGDLDIVGASDPYSLMVYQFSESTKWTPEGWVPPVSSPQGIKSLRGRTAAMVTTSQSPSKKSSSDRYTKHISVDSTLTFFTFDNAKVQLIRARPLALSGFKAALQVAKEVDITCCGLVMDKNGRVFEVVENAYDDCINKILRFNKTSRITSLNGLEVRITKLKERGWTSKISIPRLRKQKEKADKAKRSEEERLMRTKKKKSKRNMEEIRTWLAVAPHKKGPFGKEYPEIVLDIGDLRETVHPEVSLGYIKDVIRAVNSDMGFEKGKDYSYTISGRGVLTLILATEYALAVDCAVMIADKIERYGSGSSKHKKTGRIWKELPSSRSVHTKTTIAHTIRERGETDEAVPAETPREVLTFKASMAENGDIEINTQPHDFGFGEPVENLGNVEIDISSIPAEAQERVREAFQDAKRDSERHGGAPSHSHTGGMAAKTSTYDPYTFGETQKLDAIRAGKPVAGKPGKRGSAYAGVEIKQAADTSNNPEE